MYYLILLTSLLLIGGILFLIHFKFPKYKHLINERIIPFVIMAVFAVRFFSYNDVQWISGYEKYAFFGGDLSWFQNTLGELCIWFELSAFLMTIMRPFFGFKTAKFYNKYISTSILLVSACSIHSMLYMMQGNDSWSLLTVMLPIEVGSLLALAGYNAFADWKVKIAKHSYAEVATFSVLCNLATMPAFIPMYFFGLGNINYHIYDLSITHRIVLYFVIAIIPLGIYFSFRSAHKDKIRYALIFIALGTAFNFLVDYKFDVFFQPWKWPFHLCNTAMIVVPICFIFRAKKLFYFTYFINVFGAILAMTMPNYDEFALVFQPSIVQFWVNHAVAYFMPLLGVALYEFDRPKLKQYTIIDYKPESPFKWLQSTEDMSLAFPITLCNDRILWILCFSTCFKSSLWSIWSQY